jgi:hypothetical protein
MLWAMGDGMNLAAAAATDNKTTPERVGINVSSINPSRWCGSYWYPIEEWVLSLAYATSITILPITSGTPYPAIAVRHQIIDFSDRHTQYLSHHWNVEQRQTFRVGSRSHRGVESLKFEIINDRRVYLDSSRTRNVDTRSVTFF